MSNRKTTRIEVQNEFDITIPGPVPNAPEHIDKFLCDCEMCTEYNGTYQVDVDSDYIGTPELEQKG